MANEIATAFVGLAPTIDNGAISRQASTIGDSAGKTAGGKFSGAFGGAVKGIGASLIGAFAVSGAANFFSSAISGASDLNETVSKSKVIFGDQFAALDSWSSEAATNLGLSKQAALDAASGFGDMFTQLGFGADEAAKLSQGTVDLAADLGSFNNLPTEDVAQRISAAFRGEYDSLQTLIPNINAARVEQEAMAATGKTNAKELTAQEKAAAVLAIVHADGAKAAGDFARTSDGLANKQKILSANFEDVKTRIGSALVPVMNTLVGVGIKVIDFFQQNATVIGNVLSVLGPIVAVIATVIGITKAWSIAQGILNTVMALNPIGLVVIAIAALAAGLVYAYKHSETFRNIVDAAFQGVKTVVGAVWQFLQPLFKLWALEFKVLWAAAQLLWAGIKAAFDGIVSAASWLWTTIRSTFDAGVSFVAGIPGRVVSAVTGLWEFISAEAETVKNNVITFLTGIVTWVADLPTKIFDAIGDLSSLLFHKGEALVQGFIDGIEALWDKAVGLAQDLAGAIGDAIGGFFGIHSPSKLMHSMGRDVGLGLVQGMDSMVKAAQASALRLSVAASPQVERVRPPAGSMVRSLGAGVTSAAAPTGQGPSLVYQHIENNPYRRESSRERSQAGVVLGLFGELLGEPGGGVPIVGRA